MIVFTKGDTAPDFAQGAMLLVDKPHKWTSFDVVNKLRYALKTKIGHAGTLDPLATGLLILCTGKYTKQLQTLQGLDKEYTGIIGLGASTPSFDLETEIDYTYDLTGITDALIRQTTARFAGQIEQHPPAFSAIKSGGVKHYEKARKGIKVETKARQVYIHRFEITKIELPNIHFGVMCSKGTYIRSLAHDLGKALGIGAHLAALTRTSIGPYHIDDAWNLEELVQTLRDDSALTR